MLTPSINICIPTFERSSCLKVLIQSIIDSAAPEFNNNIKIFISDNNSQDGTEELVKKIISNTNISITYYKQKKNIGPLYNLIKSLDMAKASEGYYWLMGDDDKLTNNAIKEIINELGNHKQNILLLNRYICDNNLKIIKSDNYFYVDSNIVYNINDQFSYLNYLQSIKTLDGLMCFISSIIIDTSILKWILIKAEKDTFYGNCLFPHTYFLHKYILTEGAIVKYLIQPLVLWRGENSSKQINSDVKKSLINYEELVIAFIKISEDSYILNAFIRSLARTYTLRKHIGSSIDASKEEKRYIQYIINIIKLSLLKKIFFKICELMIPILRVPFINNKIRKK